MSYKPSPLGVSFDDIVQQGARLLSGAGGAVGAATRVVADPHFPELTCHIIRLTNVADGKPAGTCAPTRTTRRGGVGLKDAIVPVKLFVIHRQYPWLVPLIAAGVIGTAAFVGYSVGKGRK